MSQRRAKIRHVVACRIHGVESKDWGGKMVVVPPPTSKKDRRDGGCPYCKAAHAHNKENQE